MKTLSKTKYMHGLSCIKHIWCEFNAPELISPPDDSAKAIMEQGIEVGNLAKKLYPKGIDIPLDNSSKKTEDALKKRIPIFEATFTHNYAYCKTDILIPVNKDEWDIIEVKSSTEVKDEHIEDAAFQLYVLKGYGLNIRKVHIMVINNEYVRKGEINVKELFYMTDITDEAEEILPEVPENLEEFQKIIIGPKPNVEYGITCKEPKSCPTCSKDVENIEICNLHYFGKKAWPLVNQGITKLKDLPNIKLTEKQKIQIKATLSNKPHIDKKAIKDFMDDLKHPLSFFDFETIATAIPLYDGVRPYQAIPFQFSLHILESNGSLTHYEFLAESNSDPRQELVKALEMIPSKGTILAFNMGFEKRVLEGLAEQFPKKSKQIHNIISRLRDLIVPFKEFYYYHPKQQGSCSIKYVLPALTGKSYEGMVISNGDTASREYLKRLKEGKKLSKELREALLAYCKLDTEGMVDLARELQEI